MGFRMEHFKEHVHQLLVIVSVVLLSARAVLASTVSLSDRTIPNPGATVDVDVSVDSVTGLEGVDLTITFNSAIVTATAVNKTPGTSACSDPVGSESPAGTFSVGMACPSPPFSGGGAIMRITFEGKAAGSTTLHISSCLLNEGAIPCTTSDGSITVQGPTSTPSLTATATATQTNTATATATNTPTNTATIGPSNTPTATGTATATRTATGTVTSTGTATNTPTATATRTSTATPTATPIPTPRITGGNTEGSTRVFGTAAGNIVSPNLRIFSAGPNGTAEGGGGDDELLGSGGTDANGNFNDGAAGIGLSRALVAGERVFAIDTQNNRTGQPVTVAGGPPAPIPTLTGLGAAGLAALLGLALLWRLAAGRSTT